MIVAYADDYPHSCNYVTVTAGANQYAYTVKSRSPATWTEIRYLGVTPTDTSNFHKTTSWCPAIPGEPTYPDGGNAWFEVGNYEDFRIKVKGKFRWWVPEG
jgi:hypothetical protein